MGLSKRSAPWLSQPVVLHSSRESPCTLTEQQCAYKSAYWRNWYQADHVYALSTIWFIVATVGVFTIVHVLYQYVPGQVRRSRLWQKPAAALRYLSYKQFYVAALPSSTPSVGVMALGVIGTVFFLAMTLGPKPYYWPNTDSISYGNSPPIATRTGYMALALLPLVMALSAKANLISALTGISHAKLQIFHHWTGYAMFVLALVHTFPFIVYHIQQGDMVKEWNTEVFYWTGVVALVAQGYLTFMSFPSIRNRFYEFFKATHFLAALVFVVFFFLHCDFRLSSWDYFIATGAIYISCVIAAQIRTYFLQGTHHATLTLLPAGLIQIKIPTSTTWTPGQHVFLRFLGTGIHSLTSHPFTISSLPRLQLHNAEPEPESETGRKRTNEMTFYIKPRKGVTTRLAKAAENSATLPVLLDGPYGGLTAPLDSFDETLVIVGGSGAGFSFGVIEAILRTAVSLKKDGNEIQESGSGRQQKQKKKMQIVFSTRDPTAAEWYDDSVESLLAEYRSHARDMGMDMDVEATRSIHVTTTSSSSSSSSSRRISHSADTPKEPEKDIEKTATAVHPNPTTGSKLMADTDGDRHYSNTRPDIPSLVSLSSTITTTSSPTRVSQTRAREVPRMKKVGILTCGPRSMLHDARNAAASAQADILSMSGSGTNECNDADRAGEVVLHSECFSW